MIIQNWINGITDLSLRIEQNTEFFTIRIAGLADNEIWQHAGMERITITLYNKEGQRQVLAHQIPLGTLAEYAVAENGANVWQVPKAGAVTPEELQNLSQCYVRLTPDQASLQLETNEYLELQITNMSASKSYLVSRHDSATGRSASQVLEYTTLTIPAGQTGNDFRIDNVIDLLLQYDDNIRNYSGASIPNPLQYIQVNLNRNGIERNYTFHRDDLEATQSSLTDIVYHPLVCTGEVLGWNHIGFGGRNTTVDVVDGTTLRVFTDGSDEYFFVTVSVADIELFKKL